MVSLQGYEISHVSELATDVNLRKMLIIHFLIYPLFRLKILLLQSLLKEDDKII